MFGKLDQCFLQSSGSYNLHHTIGRSVYGNKNENSICVICKIHGVNGQGRVTPLVCNFCNTLGVVKLFDFSIVITNTFYAPSTYWSLSIVTILKGYHHISPKKLGKVVIIRESLTTPSCIQDAFATFQVRIHFICCS